MHYIDTSVLAAYYCPEPLSSRVQVILSGLTGPTISPLVELEFHSALAKKVRTQALGVGVAIRIGALLDRHKLEMRYSMLSIGPREYELAKQWLRQLNSPLRSLDALHLALAFSNGMILVTSDQTLLRSAEKFGVEHLGIV